MTACAPCPRRSGLIAALGKLGFATICATPHQRADLYLPARAAIDTAYEHVLGALPAGSPVLHLGAENFWDEVLAGRLPQGKQPTYTGGKAFLFEIPVAQWPPRIIETLFDVRMRGTLPVMAHPERYSALWNEHERIESIARTGGARHRSGRARGRARREREAGRALPRR